MVKVNPKNIKAIGDVRKLMDDLKSQSFCARETNLCGKKKDIGDQYFCLRCRNEWRYCMELLDIDELPLPEELPMMVIPTFLEHNAEIVAHACNVAAREAGYPNYLGVIISLAQKRMKQNA